MSRQHHRWHLSYLVVVAAAAIVVLIATVLSSRFSPARVRQNIPAIADKFQCDMFPLRRPLLPLCTQEVAAIAAIVVD